MPDPDRVEDKLEEFLTASQFGVEVPRHLPRLRMKVAGWWSHLASRIGNQLFEHELDTAGHARDVPHFHPDRVWYQASGWSYLRRILPRRQVSSEDLFADYGSGKGRVVLQASRYPFRRVIGVEISAELNEVARENIALQRSKQRCGDIELVEADAASWDVPDDLTVAYFYYPFVGDTFRRVIDNLVASLDRNPRRLRIVYGLPTMEDYILATGRFQAVRTVRIVSLGIPHRLSLYETRPNAELA